MTARRRQYNTTAQKRHSMTYPEMRRLIADKWPETLAAAQLGSAQLFITGLSELDTLFPQNGIPFGQLIEITGQASSGKTSLLLRLLARAIQIGTAGYIDFSGSFFPPGAVAVGVDPDRLLVVKPDSVGDGLRAAELLFRHDAVCCVVCDLLGVTTRLPLTLTQRLRRDTVKARALMLFLTDYRKQILPPSMVSLRLDVSRTEQGRFAVHVSKSRICNEGGRVEVNLDD